MPWSLNCWTRNSGRKEKAPFPKKTEASEAALFFVQGRDLTLIVFVKHLCDVFEHGARAGR